MKKLTQSTARSIKNTLWMTEKELNSAYDLASRNGEGDVYNIYLKELDRRYMINQSARMVG